MKDMPRKFNVTDAQRGAALAVRVFTEAEQVDIAGLDEDGALIVYLTESADDGRADEQLIAVLADAFDLAADQLAIVVGHNRPAKIVSARGVTTEWIEQRLAALL
jgi:uncharacterized protein YggU (UPF0235/DUF167 family)